MKGILGKAITIFCAVTLTVSLAGCGSSKKETPPSTKSSDKPVQTQSDEKKPAAPPSQSDTMKNPAPEPSPAPDPVDLFEVLADIGMPPILTSKYYYLDGDEYEMGFYFYDNGEVDIEDSDDSITCDYVIEGNEITITLDGEEAVLTILDTFTLEDEDGNLYAIAGSLGTELETAEYYYLYGDEFAGSLYFYDDGDVDIENEDGDVLTGTYETGGTTITVGLDGEEAELEIISGFILMSDEDNLFIRMP